MISSLGHRHRRPIARRIIIGMETTSIRINRPTKHIPTLLRLHRILIILGPPRRAKPVILVLRPDRGQEVDDEAPDVEDVDERDNPFDDGGFVVFGLVGEDAEGDCEAQFDEDEAEFYPEGGAQDAVFAEVDAEALVFGADEDGGDDVAGAGLLC